eukprot:2228455-Amphidinium_carterae.1
MAMLNNSGPRGSPCCTRFALDPVKSVKNIYLSCWHTKVENEVPKHCVPHNNLCKLVYPQPIATQVSFSRKKGPKGAAHSRLASTSRILRATDLQVVPPPQSLHTGLAW